VLRKKILDGEFFQYFSILFCLVLTLYDLINDGGPWGWALPVYAALLLVYLWWPCTYNHFYLAVHLGLIVAATWLHPIGLMLGFTFSVYALLIYPDRRGALWVGLCALWPAIHFGLSDSWPAFLFTLLGIAAGYGSIGFSYVARRQAEQERRNTEALLAELQEAHRQLKASAGQAQELAVSEERNRLAREMHDTLGHHLTVSSVQLEAAQRLVSRDPERAIQLVETVRTQITDALGELRRTVATLRAPLEADLPLDSALQRLVHGFGQATGLQVCLELPERLPEMPFLQRLAFYRAAQEGLTNVQRHAQAHTAWVRLYPEANGMSLQVADDGIGLPESGLAETGLPAGGGFGLRGVRERALHLGGRVTLENRPEGGAMVTLWLPLDGGDQPGS